MAPKRSTRKAATVAAPLQEEDEAMQVEAEESTATASGSASSSLSAISSLFPLAHPIPNPLEDPELIPADDVVLEQELMLNPDNPRSYLNYIQHILTSNPIPGRTSPLPKPDTELSSIQASLLGPLSSKATRLSLKRVVGIYERTLSRFPTSYPLWRDYLLLRCDFVLGTPKGGNKIRKKKMIQSGRLTLDVGPTLLDGTQKELEKGNNLELVFEGGLDGVVGWKEWRSLAAVCERALMWLPNVSPS